MPKLIKKHSPAWKLARTIARRKHCPWYPFELLEDGSVIVYYYLSGLEDRKTLQDLERLK